MLNRRDLLRTGAAALAAATLPIETYAAPRTNGSWVELDRNENPWGPSPAARKAIMDAAARGGRYLDGAELDAFRDQLALREGVTRDSIVLGAGSSEILWMASEEFLGRGDVLLLGDPTFELMGRCAERNGAELARIAVDPEQNDDLGAFEKRLTDKVKLTYLCWPNNPCGSMHPAGDVSELVKKAAERAPVLVDEAYLDYADPDLKRSMVSLVRQGANVIVARTFSKIHGLAGMRMGYGVALPETAKRLARWRFSVPNSLALFAAAASLGDREFLQLARKRNEEGRQIACRAFDEAGIKYVPSSTSFVWFRDPGLDEKMKAARILIPKGRFAGGWNRVTIGTLEEMNRFAEALRS
ncbi:MAG: histidinol-phosphate transaminase [Thermoanaerobaculia bacterium]